jgi:hypothetical protein
VEKIFSKEKTAVFKAAENAFEIFGAFPGTLFVYFVFFCLQYVSNINPWWYLLLLRWENLASLLS